MFISILRKVLFVAGLLVPSVVFAGDWYVDIDNDGGTENGTSWATAWGKLSDIVWGSIAAGDTVWISDGEYNQRLSVEASGSAVGGYIYVKPGGAHPTLSAGHSGTVYIDGTGAGVLQGISISSQDYIEINGNVGGDQSIVVKDWTLSGIQVSGTADHIKLLYIEITNCNIVSGSAAGIYISASWNQTLVEIAYCEIHDQYYGDELWTVQPAVSDAYEGYDSLLIHHNDIYDFHADACKLAHDNTSFYNNTIRDRGTYGSDHPDGIQSYADHMKIYNNTFYNFLRTDDSQGNSYIRHNPDANDPHPWADPHDYHIFNNLFYETNTPEEGSVFRGIEISYSDPTVTSVNGCYLFNNTLVGIPYAGIILSFQAGETTGDISNIFIENNILENCGWNGATPFSLTIGSNVTYGDHGEAVDVVFDYNSVYTVTNITYAGSAYSYSEFLALNKGMANGLDNAGTPLDPGLTASYELGASSNAVDHGVDLSGYFTTDRDGNTRSGTWDMGSYEYGSGVTAPTALGVSLSGATLQ